MFKMMRLLFVAFYCLLFQTRDGCGYAFGYGYHIPSARKQGSASATSVWNNIIGSNVDEQPDPGESTVKTTTSRRNLLQSAALSLAGALIGEGFFFDTNPAIAADDDVATPLYFGVGCFWHIQHEFIEQGEKKILGRQPNQYTSAAGYAGGKSTDKEGRVCYHNFQGIADYGKLGHGEVVGMTIPQSKIVDFAQLYFSLYDPKTKDRVDPQDRGAEYRSLLGLPGGINHASYPLVEAAATNAGFKLVEGKGNDGDTLGKQIVYVYDSNLFPFYQGELYHQYHNDFQSRAYGKAYNDLANVAYEDGRIKSTGCPDRI